MGARILVIEDNPANLELMMYLLSALGHHPSSAMDGGDALDAVRSRQPDLVICDLQLPRVDGYHVARCMKADPRLMGIPLVAVTAFAMPGDRENALKAGFDGYISKPIMPETFLRQIGKLLEASGRPPVPSDTFGAATVLVLGRGMRNRLRIRRVLEPRGLKVIFAASARDAAREEMFDEADLVLAEEAVDPQDLGDVPPDLRASVTSPAPDDDRQLAALVDSLLVKRARMS